jgi:hypothetical protein
MNEDLVNDLIEVIWPALDGGKDKSDIMDAVHNVLDSWTPKEGEE